MINSPWRVLDLHGVGGTAFRFGIADCFGTIVGRFDTEEHARRAVDAVNHEVINTR